MHNNAAVYHPEHSHNTREPARCVRGLSNMLRQLVLAPLLLAVSACVLVTPNEVRIDDADITVLDGFGGQYVEIDPDNKDAKPGAAITITPLQNKHYHVRKESTTDGKTEVSEYDVVLVSLTKVFQLPYHLVILKKLSDPADVQPLLVMYIKDGQVTYHTFTFEDKDLPSIRGAAKKYGIELEAETSLGMSIKGAVSTTQLQAFFTDTVVTDRIKSSWPQYTLARRAGQAAPAVANAGAGLAININNANQSCNHAVIPYKVTFPVAMNNGDTFELYNNEAQVLSYRVQGNQGITSFSSRMNAIVKSSLTFRAVIGGKTYQQVLDWNPPRTIQWLPRVGTADIGPMRKRAKGNTLKVLLNNPMGMHAFIQQVNVAMPGGGINLELSPLVSSNPYLGFEFERQLNDNAINVNAGITRTPPYRHAVSYLSRYRQHVAEGRTDNVWAAQCSGIKDNLTNRPVSEVLQHIDELVGLLGR